jgi:hydrogenase-4 membrane subunit HyfE
MFCVITQKMTLRTQVAYTVYMLYTVYVVAMLLLPGSPFLYVFCYFQNVISVERLHPLSGDYVALL